MSTKRFRFSIALSLAFLCFTIIALGNQGIGKALSEAMQSRATSTIEDVIANFENVAGKATSPAQKGSVLGLLADFLMEKQEWNKTIEIDEKIIAEGTETDKPGAYYGIAQSYLMLSQPEKAKAMCAVLRGNFPNSAMEGFANYMKGISPNSVHAKLAEFFAESPSVPLERPQETPTAKENQATSVSEKSTEGVTESLPTPPATKEERQEAAASEKVTQKNRLVFDARGWNSDLYGNINSKGMSLDLNNDTDIGRQTSFAIAGTWQFSRRDQLRFDYTQFDHTGNLSRAVTFDKLLYNPGSSINMKTSFFDAGLSRLLDESEHGFWKFLYGVKFSKTYMQIAQPTVKGTQAGEVNSNLGVPYLGIEGEANLSGNVKLNGSLKYFSLNGGGASGRLTDLDVSLLFGRDYAKEPAETEWYGTLGYRYFLLHGKADNDSEEIRYSGPTFGLESRF